MTAKRVVYKQWAGIRLSGTQEWPAPLNSQEHMERAAWLTARVETGAKFGTINSYDGTAMSAGIEHKIAVLPRTMEQGSLWGLLRKLPPNSPDVRALLDELAQVGWYIDPRNILRVKSTGRKVSAADIRSEFTPPSGTIPPSGPHFQKAIRWAELWSRAFADPATFQTQIDEAKRSLLLSHKALESQVYSVYASLEDASAATTTNISPELDLAMCVYHSFSVNAPTKARKALETALVGTPGQITFCRRLIRLLGTSEFAKWKLRYLRTRLEAKKSGLWDSTLFQDIAPEKF